MTFQEDDLRFVMLDYNYQSMRTRTNQTDSLSIILVETGWPLGELTVRPERMLDKLAHFFTGKGLRFESPEFNERFFVSSPDPGWATEFIHPDMMEYLTWSQYRTVIEIHEGIIAVYTGARFEPHEFDRYLKHLKKILSLIPERLRHRPPEA